MNIILVINIIIFLIYNGYIIWKYGIPTSLSETSYLLNSKKWLFTLLCCLTGISTLPIWFNTGEYDYIKFITMMCLIFTGLTPLFKDNYEGKIHYTCSIICCIGMLLWLALSGYWWSLGIGIGIFILLTIMDHKRVIYYGELCCWLGLLISLLISIYN